MYGIWSEGTLLCTLAVLVTTLRVALETLHWTYLNQLAIWGSVLFYFGLVYVYCLVLFLEPSDMFWVLYELSGAIAECHLTKRGRGREGAGVFSAVWQRSSVTVLLSGCHAGGPGGGYLSF